MVVTKGWAGISGLWNARGIANSDGVTIRISHDQLLYWCIVEKLLDWD